VFGTNTVFGVPIESVLQKNWISFVAGLLLCIKAKVLLISLVLTRLLLPSTSPIKVSLNKINCWSAGLFEGASYSFSGIEYMPSAPVHPLLLSKDYPIALLDGLIFNSTHGRIGNSDWMRKRYRSQAEFPDDNIPEVALVVKYPILKHPNDCPTFSFN